VEEGNVGRGERLIEIVIEDSSWWLKLVFASSFGTVYHSVHD